MTLSKHLSASSDEQLGSVLKDLADAAKQISHAVQRSGLLDLHGAVGSQNVHDEQVQKLDEFSNETLKQVLSANDYVLAIASEEEDEVVDVSGGKVGGYVIAFDPLDGSSNIDVNLPIGTIFSILPAGKDLEASVLQPGAKQVGAGYFLYGSSTVVVFSLGDKVVEFTLDPDAKDFILSNPDIKLPKNEGFIAYNSSLLPNMKAEQAETYQNLLTQSGLSQRWVGAMVADVHRTLLKGGFFAYPRVNKDGKYEAKLRVQYEGKPLGWLVERAGGKALLDGQPVDQFQSSELHQKAAVELGDVGVMALLDRLT